MQQPAGQGELGSGVLLRDTTTLREEEPGIEPANHSEIHSVVSDATEITSCTTFTAAAAMLRCFLNPD